MGFLSRKSKMALQESATAENPQDFFSIDPFNILLCFHLRTIAKI
jgi:hypothetical protein